MTLRPRRSLSYDHLACGVARRILHPLRFVAAPSIAALVVACVGPMRGRSAAVIAPLSLSFPVDTVRSARVAAGVVYHYVHSPVGPWAMHLLLVDRSACWDLRAVKAHHGAIGREPASAMLRALAEREQVIGGVNADFFSFAPPGIPTGAHVEEGTLIVGPGVRPVVGVDSSGTAFIGTLAVGGTVSIGGVEIPLAGWNRLAPRGLALLDPAWGAASDSGTGRVEVSLAGIPLRVLAIDTVPAGLGIPAAGVLLVAGRGAGMGARRALLALEVGDTVVVDLHLTRTRLRAVVGGWPVILRDSAVTRAADSAGASFAPVRHPRTAVGLARNGRELIIVVVDGRQTPYSDGMTLRELAELFRALGARDALNLDGGGSSTFVLADSASGQRLTVRNRPSDKTERAVGNALAVARSCK